jgi:hypothetical protein
MSANGEWTTISANDYQFAFERFGGSFALHPRVVAIVASLARRPVRYAGLIREGALLAAVPLWGEHVVATKPALEFYGKSHLIDVGDSEVVLPVAEDARINMPFTANMVSNLHENNISNLKHETDFTLMLAKGIRIGNHRLSKKRQKERRRQIRRFQEVGGTFRPIGDFSADETAAVYTKLFEKRWGFCPIAKDLLPTVLQELKDMLCGDIMLLRDRPVAIRLIYRNETSRWLFANAVNGGVDPEFHDLSPGTILLFRTLEYLEQEAGAGNKALRFSCGRNDANYKKLWCFEVPTYRL